MLRRRLILPAVMIAVVLLLALTGLGIWAGRVIISITSGQLIMQMNQTVLRDVSDMTRSADGALSRMINGLAWHDIPLDDPAAVGRELYGQLRDERHVQWLAFGNEGGGVIDAGRDRGLMAEVAAQGHNHHARITGVQFRQQPGRLIAAAAVTERGTGKYITLGGIYTKNPVTGDRNIGCRTGTKIADRGRSAGCPCQTKPRSPRHTSPATTRCCVRRRRSPAIRRSRSCSTCSLTNFIR